MTKKKQAKMKLGPLVNPIVKTPEERQARIDRLLARFREANALKEKTAREAREKREDDSGQ